MSADPAIPFFDSHAHLANEAFETDADDAIARLTAAGGEGVLCVGESVAAAGRARTLASRHSGRVWWSAGIHPHDAASFEPVRDVAALNAAFDAGAIAVGECGLDYHYDHSPRDQQRAAFGSQLEIAADRSLPVIVHTREAVDDTAAMVRDAGRAGVKGVLHCFTGPLSLAEVALDAGWYISFSGIITFRNWTDEALLRGVPADRVIVESDSPYLAPVPHRGKRNEPAWVRHTVERLASVRAVSPGAFGRTTCDNTRRLFGLAWAESAS